MLSHGPVGVMNIEIIVMDKWRGIMALCRTGRQPATVFKLRLFAHHVL